MGPRSCLSRRDDLAHQIVITSNLHSLYDTEGGIDAVADEMHELCHMRGWYSASDNGLQLLTIPSRLMPRGCVPRPNGGPPRGLAEQGAPRKELLTASGGQVEALNVSAGPVRHTAGDTSPKWFTEVKPTLADAAVNAAILAFSRLISFRWL